MRPGTRAPTISSSNFRHRPVERGSPYRIATDASFNPDNVGWLLGKLPAGSFAISLVEAAMGEGTGTPAERVAALLGKRVEEVRAQLDGADLA